MIVHNWNRNPVVKDPKLVDYPSSVQGQVCVRGNGRSYGDASLLNNMVSMLNHREECTIENGILSVSSGYILGEVLNYCINNNYFFPVIPGTQHVTIGGMIASDVHGKNHVDNGTIGCWVEEFTLIDNNETRLTCSSEKNEELFKATIGGMGLTGIIEHVKIRLIPLKGTRLQSEVHTFNSMENLLSSLDASTAEYRVAWLDLLNQPSYFLTESNFIAEELKKEYALPLPKRTIPKIPVGLINKSMMKSYNRILCNKMNKRTSFESTISESFFPLDSIGEWNRLYGRKGFFQYQFLLPKSTALSGLNKILDILKDSKHQPVLAVLKKHGDKVSPGHLSFPIDGYSLALDFLNRSGIKRLFRQLNQIVIEEGGRIYLAKDCFMDEEEFTKMYPKASQFKDTLKTSNIEGFSSLLAKRLNLTS